MDKIREGSEMDLEATRELLGVPSIKEDEFHYTVLKTDIVVVDRDTKNKLSHGRVHGENSKNFIQQKVGTDDLRLDGIKNALDQGKAVVGGFLSLIHI